MADGETVSITGVYPDDGMILFQKARTTERFGYSMDTGQLVWTSQPEVQFQYYGMSQNYFNHTLYSSGYGGVITAYDVKTGNVQWHILSLKHWNRICVWRRLSHSCRYDL